MPHGVFTKKPGSCLTSIPAVMTREELARLREVSVSAGIMLESISRRLCEKGGPHYGSPDKDPAVRLATMERAGELAVPFTTGILIGIGETRRERVESLIAIRDLEDRHGHIQEVIVQNFRAKPGTPMATAPEPSLEDHLWTIAVARLVLGSGTSVQAPPNLRPGALARLIEAGLDDWGGVSPVTPDHVNPEAPWPHLLELERATEAAGKSLAPRLPLHPRFVLDLERWVAPELRSAVLAAGDGQGLGRDSGWHAGDAEQTPAFAAANGDSESPREPVGNATAAVWTPAFFGADFVQRRASPSLAHVLDRVREGTPLDEAQVVRLFEARGGEAHAVCEAADRLRRERNGDVVSYVVNRNINYTNVCYFKCRFCAFSKGRLSANLRGRPYDLDLPEIARRTREAWDRGATEICLQGGIHPDYTGETYLSICRAVKDAAPEVHVHAFSPLEVWQGARTLGIELPAFLERLREAGLGSLPGTAAEILDDEVRRDLCPDKITTNEWLEVMESAHRVGLGSTATIMFGHIDRYRNWARHLLRGARSGRAHRRVHRARPAPLRAHGIADVPARPRPARTDAPRSGPDARGRPARARSVDREHPDLVGEDGAGRDAPRTRGGCQRCRRNPHERVDYPGGGSRIRSGDAAGAARIHHPRGRTIAPATHHPLLRRAGGTLRRCVRCARVDGAGVSPGEAVRAGLVRAAGAIRGRLNVSISGPSRSPIREASDAAVPRALAHAGTRVVSLRAALRRG